MDLDPTAEEEKRQIESHNVDLVEAALFSASAGAVDIDVHVPTGGVTIGIGSMSMMTMESIVVVGDCNDLRKRPLKSRVQDDFDAFTDVKGGKSIRISFVYHHYKHTLSARSTYGIGHLL